MKKFVAALIICVGACSEPVRPSEPRAAPLEIGATVSDWQATSEVERVKFMRHFVVSLLPSARPEQLEQAAEDLERCVDGQVAREVGSAPVDAIAYRCERLVGLR